MGGHPWVARAHIVTHECSWIRRFVRSIPNGLADNVRLKVEATRPEGGESHGNGVRRIMLRLLMDNNTTAMTVRDLERSERLVANSPGLVVRLVTQ